MTGLSLAVGLLGLSGLAAVFLNGSPRLATGVAALGAVAACAAGLWPAVSVLTGGPPLAMKWVSAGAFGDFELGVDPLSAFFLVPLLGLGGVTAAYGREYLLAYQGRKWLGPPALFFNLLVASMVVVLTARTAVLFLIAWEVMSLSAYLLVSFDDELPEVRRAGWVFLICAHLGLACLTALFLLLDQHAHGLSFSAFLSAPPMGAGLSAGLFALAVVGFGVKAGFVPVHVWLPEAHAAAPSHVSALMSGVLIKLGLYGLLRTLTFLPRADWWGPTLIVVGLSGALFGITLALYQRDLKRVLAYSSIENVGLVTVGLGIAFWGASRNLPAVAALGALGALLHLWNHVLMKGLLFLAAGSGVHGAGTRDLERLGGLVKRMPHTAAALLVGSVAIAGLPPLNGFVSEWLLYRGLIGGGSAFGGAGGVLSLLSVGVVSGVGGLTALCFMRASGVALLGQARSDAAAQAHESSAWMTGPMWLLAALAGAAALFPGRLAAALAGTIGQLFGATVRASATAELSGLTRLGEVGFWLWVALGAAWVALAWLVRAPAPEVGTWDCGYAAPTSRMQYTARSFSQLFEDLLPSALRARAVLRAPRSYFPPAGSYATQCDDPLTRGLYLPFIASWADRFARLRWLQQGHLHMYLLYILVVVVLALAWVGWTGGVPP